MYCIVVKRGGFQTYDLLHKAFGQEMAVVWERRHADRRLKVRSLAILNRRRLPRRGIAPASWTALGFVVAKR